MKTEWNLNILYAGFQDQAYLADKEALKTAVSTFSDAVRKAKAPLTAGCLEDLLKKAEDVDRLMESLYVYASLRQSANTEDSEAMAESAGLMRTYASVAGDMAAAKKLAGGVENLDELAAESEVIAGYRYFIEEAKRDAEHLMSNEEEALYAAMDATGGTAWGDLQAFLTSTLKVDYDGKVVTLSEIRNLAHSTDPAVRKAAYEAEIAAYEKVRDSVAFALNQIKNQVTLISARRKFATPLDQALYASKMSRKTLDAMMAAVKESLPVFRKYFRKKAELLGHSNGLPWYDLFAPIGENDTKFTVEETRDYLLNCFGELSEDVRKLMEDAFRDEWIDFFPRNGKVGGAFDCGIPDKKVSRVLTNFDGNFESVDTLAHELGHAFHDRQVQDEPVLCRDYPMPVAETASTFNEVHLGNYALKKASGKEALALLEGKLCNTAQCVVDIYSRYLFETAVFEETGSRFLMADDLNEIMLHCQEEAYGDGLDPEVRHPYMWLCKSHYYSSGLSFYNFPYTFGNLFAEGLYALFREDPAGFMPKYKEMLRTTPVHTMEENGAIMGVDLTDEAFWRKSLKGIEEEIERFCREE